MAALSGWAFFSAQSQYTDLVQARRDGLGAEAIAVAERELSRRIDRDLFMTLLHDAQGFADRRAVFFEMQAKRSTSDHVWAGATPHWLDDFRRRVEASLAPLWVDLGAEDAGFRSGASALAAQRFAHDTSLDRGGTSSGVPGHGCICNRGLRCTAYGWSARAAERSSPKRRSTRRCTDRSRST
ncbi:MAG: hypothetical protein ABI895_11460 [Deltaproteobacteria bacterium]